MRYMDSLKFITARPGWFMNLLMCAVCMIIPAIGGIVLLGYLMDVFDSVRRDPSGKSYPDFTFNKFVPYLTRGIWIFLVQFVVSMIFVVPMWALFFCAGMAGAAAGKDGGPAIAIILQLVAGLVGFTGGLFLSVITWPIAIYEGLRQELDVKGLIAFSRDFIRRMWKETLISMLFLIVVSIPLNFVGLLACCVGIYLTSAALVLAQYHLKAQTYTLYLERGGTPVPEKGRRDYPSDEALTDAPPPRTPPAGSSDAFTAEPPPG
jgi:hypothetical protein